MYVCMYVHTCVCLFAGRHVRMHVSMHVCTYARTSVCMKVSMYACMHACVYIRAYLYTKKGTHTYEMSACICTHIETFYFGM